MIAVLVFSKLVSGLKNEIRIVINKYYCYLNMNKGALQGPKLDEQLISGLGQTGPAGYWLLKYILRAYVITISLF